MSYSRFVSFNTGAIVVWAVTYASAGYVFGEYWDELLTVTRSVGFLLLAAVALILVGTYVYRRYYSTKKKDRGRE